MKCQKCGKKLKEGEIFCSICGYCNQQQSKESGNWDFSDLADTFDEGNFYDDEFDIEEDDKLDKNLEKELKKVKKVKIKKPRESIFGKKKEKIETKVEEDKKEIIDISSIKFDNPNLNINKEENFKFEDTEFKEQSTHENNEKIKNNKNTISDSTKEEKKSVQDILEKLKKENLNKFNQSEAKEIDMKLDDFDKKDLIDIVDEKEKNKGFFGQIKKHDTENKNQSYVSSIDDFENAQSENNYISNINDEDTNDVPENNIEDYIGEDYKSIRNVFFNIYALLFNWMYVLYRKMYGVGIIGMILSWIIVAYFKQYLLIYFIAISVLLGLFFNKIYIAVAKVNVEKLLNKYEGTDENTLSEIIRKKGGVNAPVALFLYFIFLVALIFSGFNIKLEKTNIPKYINENSTNEANCNTMMKYAYANISQNSQNNLDEGACKINNDNGRKIYKIYLKTIENNQSIYHLFNNDGQYIVFQGDTYDVSKMESLLAANNLNDNDKLLLNELKNMPNAYEDIKTKSKEEIDNIAKKQEEGERKNFIFTKEEITR